MRRALLVVAATFAAGPVTAAEPLWEQSLSQQLALANGGGATAESLTRLYLDRIETLDRRGPRLNSVLALNPDALKQAAALDASRRTPPRVPLYGAVILVKDNIETADPVATTAGSLALKDNIT